MEPNGKIADNMEAEQIRTFDVIETISDQIPHQHVSKAADILEACAWNDTQRLRDLAVSEAGLLSDEIRRQVC
jgi:hypothetical protein